MFDLFTFSFIITVKKRSWNALRQLWDKKIRNFLVFLALYIFFVNLVFFR